jgi:hypothetical protein
MEAALVGFMHTGDKADVPVQKPSPGIAEGTRAAGGHAQLVV